MELKDTAKLMDKHSDKNTKKEKMVEAGLELKKALSTWEELTRDCHGPSADEQMLEDMQTLLKKLKTQIEELK